MQSQGKVVYLFVHSFIDLFAHIFIHLFIHLLSALLHKGFEVILKTINQK